LAPILLGGVAAALLLGALSGLGGSELAAGVAASGLLVTGLAALFAWGSAWDGDLGLEIETGLKGLLQEQSPLTPVRALLVALGGLFLAAGIGGLAALRTLPAPLGLAALAGLDVLVLGLAWRAGLGGLRRLTF
jgi:hypothetical protein